MGFDFDSNLFARYQVVVFDRDPLPTPEEAIIQEEKKSEAILKNFGLDGRNFLAYMVPKKRKRDETETMEEFEWVREYSYEVKKGREFSDTYFLHFQEDKVVYTPINTRVQLTKSKTRVVSPSSWS